MANHVLHLTLRLLRVQGACETRLATVVKELVPPLLHLGCIGLAQLLHKAVHLASDKQTRQSPTSFGNPLGRPPDLPQSARGVGSKQHHANIPHGVLGAKGRRPRCVDGRIPPRSRLNGLHHFVEVLCVHLVHGLRHKRVARHIHPHRLAVDVSHHLMLLGLSAKQLLAHINAVALAFRLALRLLLLHVGLKLAHDGIYVISRGSLGNHGELLFPSVGRVVILIPRRSDAEQVAVGVDCKVVNLLHHLVLVADDDSRVQHAHQVRQWIVGHALTASHLLEDVLEVWRLRNIVEHVSRRAIGKASQRHIVIVALHQVLKGILVNHARLVADFKHTASQSLHRLPQSLGVGLLLKLIHDTLRNGLVVVGVLAKVLCQATQACTVFLFLALLHKPFVTLQSMLGKQVVVHSLVGFFA